ncbi:LysR family transcriptional regulator [Luteipulveratus halotolerans]|uniref:LysR family transcriptional regulator n=1 Tax=Luteipulveratus halotolerans TaxID=1631356 RepID=A0A0L6CMY5_9MICO|nr:LysR family transcriptional regulator [Luteipulveratus halotolerans]KNX39104.1 LysR family transcriptional regulator [Luteipulveratus halotolerans]
MLDVHRLRVLRAVVACGSINAAAVALGYTPSAVSQQLTTLQRETGLQLVERKGRGIEPTPAGRTLAAESARVLETLAGVEGLVGDLRAGRAGSLSISYFASAGSAWIPPVVAALVQEFPDLRLDLRLVELAGDESPSPDVDIFVASPGAVPSREGYAVGCLLEDPYVAAIPAGHPLAHAGQVGLIDLAGEHWVDNDFSRGPCRQVFLDACARVGIVPDFRIETHDYPTALSFVAAGVGITVLPELSVGSLPDGVAVVRLVDPTPVRHVYVAARGAVANHPAVVRALDLLDERVNRPTGVPASA